MVEALQKVAKNLISILEKLQHNIKIFDPETQKHIKPLLAFLEKFKDQEKIFNDFSAQQIDSILATYDGIISFSKSKYEEKERIFNAVFEKSRQLIIAAVNTRENIQSILNDIVVDYQEQISAKPDESFFDANFVLKVGLAVTIGVGFLALAVVVGFFTCGIGTLAMLAAEHAVLTGIIGGRALAVDLGITYLVSRQSFFGPDGGPPSPSSSNTVSNDRGPGAVERTTAKDPVAGSMAAAYGAYGAGI